MKKSTLLLLISTALFFTSTLVLLYLNYLKPNSTYTPTITQTPTVVPTASLSDWKTYENKQYGFSFDYPSFLTVTSEEKPGETGKSLYINIVSGNKEQALFGGITADYSAGRGGSFFDTQGYIVKNNLVYCKFTQDNEILLNKPIFDKIITNPNKVEIVKVFGQADDFASSSPGDPGAGNYGALINLPNKVFTGLAMLHHQQDDLLTDQQFDQILSTFKFYP